MVGAMKRSNFPRSSLGFAAVASLGANSIRAFAIDPPDTSGPGWKDLFDKDLSDAVQPTKWSWQDGLLVAGDHETLWTKESYGDFILDLDFKVAKESNSGVFLHSWDIKNVLGCIEIQVHDNTDGTKYGMVGAMYDCLPPSKDVHKPVGEWNHFTITFKGSKLNLVFNGEEVINTDLDKWSEKGMNPDGTKNKFPKPMKDYAAPGPMGLQGLHGKAQAPVWYKNLRVKKMD
jgi:hypothetical protein